MQSHQKNQVNHTFQKQENARFKPDFCRKNKKMHKKVKFFPKKFGDIKKSCTFASELIERLFQNLHSLLVISFSVINYVVSMRVCT